LPSQPTSHPRFGVTLQEIRRQLRLGAVSPKLTQVYRDGGQTLDGLAVSKDGDDHFEVGVLLDPLTLKELLVPRCG
jgi:ParB family transcriptional regulator, chromosome partitioning protein